MTARSSKIRSFQTCKLGSNVRNQTDAAYYVRLIPTPTPPACEDTSATGVPRTPGSPAYDHRATHGMPHDTNIQGVSQTPQDPVGNTNLTPLPWSYSSAPGNKHVSWPQPGSLTNRKSRNIHNVANTAALKFNVMLPQLSIAGISEHSHPERDKYDIHAHIRHPRQLRPHTHSARAGPEDVSDGDSCCSA